MANVEKLRYNSLNHHLKNKYGEKVYKICLNGGMSCPNRDGTIGSSGCIFCSRGGSGDFSEDKKLSITEQIESGKKRVKNKIKSGKYIAYFQAYTNTYAPASYLRRIFTEAINHPDIAVLSIATRPDCISDEALDLMKELNEIKPIWVELGLQSIHKKSADFIKRGYELDVFDSTAKKLKSIGVEVIVHLILGLPFETKEEMLESVDYVCEAGIDGIKLQLLHVIENTELEKYYKNNEFKVLEKQEYIELIVECIKRIPEDIVIHRLTGDGPKAILIAPQWSKNKKDVLNSITRELCRQDVYQGQLCESKKNN